MEIPIGRHDTSARQDWHNFSDDLQQDVNRTLAEIGQTIDYLNSRLYQARLESQDEYIKVSQQIIKSLDELWQHHGARFLVTGHWHFPHGELTDRSLKLDYKFEPAFGEGISRGFIVDEVWTDNGLLPRVGLSFDVKTENVDTPIMRFPLTMRALAEPHQVNVQFLRPASSEVVSSSIEDVVKAIQVADDILDTELSDPKSRFYRLSPQDQHGFFMSLVDIVEGSMPDPQSGDKLLIHDAIAQHVYFNHVQTQSLVSLGGSSEHSPLLIAGQVLGVTVPDAIKHGPYKHYTSPDQVIAATTGLNFVIRPYAQSFDLGSSGNPDILLPVRDTSYGLQFQQ